MPGFARRFYQIVAIVVTFLALFNILVIFFFNKLNVDPGKSNADVTDLSVKSVWVTDTGSVKVSLAGLLLPAHGPSNGFMKERIINDHKYRYLNNPRNACKNKSIDLVVSIVSSSINFDQRRIARRSRVTLSGSVVYLFFLGASQLMLGLQQRIDKEASVYGDIVQEDFIDTTRNLSLKSVSVLKWVTDFCQQAKFVLKKDDDVRLNLYHILSAFLQKETDYQHFIIGNSKYLVEGPIRDEVSKYYTSHTEFGETFFPMFAHGPAYGYPGKTAEMLYQVSLRTKLFWLEDVYITGICANRAGIPVFFDRRFLYKHVSEDSV